VTLLEYSPIIISWVRPNGYGYILTIGRENKGCRNLVHFSFQEAIG